MDFRHAWFHVVNYVIRGLSCSVFAFLYVDFLFRVSYQGRDRLPTYQFGNPSLKALYFSNRYSKSQVSL